MMGTRDGQLLKAIADLQRRADALEQQNAALSARVQFLEGHVGHSLPHHLSEQRQWQGGSQNDPAYRQQQRGFDPGPQFGRR